MNNKEKSKILYTIDGYPDPVEVRLLGRLDKPNKSGRICRNNYRVIPIKINKLEDTVKILTDKDCVVSVDRIKRSVLEFLNNDKIQELNINNIPYVTIERPTNDDTDMNTLLTIKLNTAFATIHSVDIDNNTCYVKIIREDLISNLNMDQYMLRFRATYDPNTESLTIITYDLVPISGVDYDE